MLKFHVKSPITEHIVLNVYGRIDRNTVPKLRRNSLKLVCQKGCQRIELDLTEALCADSSSIAVMVEIHRAAKVRGVQLIISGIAPNVSRTLSLFHLDKVFEDVIVPEKQKAMMPPHVRPSRR